MLRGLKLCAQLQRWYDSGVGKLLCLVKWSRPEISNSVHELTWFMIDAYPACVKGAEWAMQHVLVYPECRIVMQPYGAWDGSKEFEFEIDAISNSGNATEPKSWKQCGGLQVFLNKAPIAYKSTMQPSVLLSMVEGKLIAVVKFLGEGVACLMDQ